MIDRYFFQHILLDLLIHSGILYFLSAIDGDNPFLMIKIKDLFTIPCIIID